jgi:hypothetical protein
MQTVDVSGQQLTHKLFIQVFRDVVKLSPARFLTLRIHPDQHRLLYGLADIPEMIMIGPVPAMLGKMVMKVNCVKPPQSIGDGITIILDQQTQPDRLVFCIHGIPEYLVVNLATP